MCAVGVAHLGSPCGHGFLHAGLGKHSVESFVASNEGVVGGVA
jgi:hypothetical protein